MLNTLDYTTGQSVQPHGAQAEAAYEKVAATGTHSPQICIRGDLCFYVTEEAARRPVTGHYSLDVQGMQKPLFVLWHGEGEVSSPHELSTDVIFDLCNAKAGQVCTHIVQAQVMERNGGRCVVSSVFVQIFVTEKPIMEIL